MEEMDAIMRRLGYKVHDKVGDHKLVPGTEEILSRFEKAVGYPMPSDFREFLQRYEGASLYDVVALPTVQDPRLDPGEFFSISDFFGFYTAGPHNATCSYDLTHNYHRHKDQLPEGTIPIAESGDNRFCISCTGDTIDHVFAWLPPEFGDDDPAGEIFLLARSFMEFLRTLRVRED